MKYLLGFKCQFSGVVFVHPMASKDGSLEGFKRFVKSVEEHAPDVEKQLGHRPVPRIIRCDREASFMSAAGGVETAVEEFVRASSFKFEPATAGDHRMNGLIENFWRGLVDGANCLLKDKRTRASADYRRVQGPWVRKTFRDPAVDDAGEQRLFFGTGED